MFREYPSSGSRDDTCGYAGGGTDTTKLINVFRDYANEPKMTTWVPYHYFTSLIFRL